MNIDSFLTIYKTKKSEEARRDYVKGRIKDRYLPISDKQSLAQNIISECYANDVRDSVKKYVMTFMVLISAYTDLDVAKDYDGMVKQFDKLNECDALKYLIVMMKETELNEFKLILDFVECDRM